jgi:hypothetical protein
MRPFHEYLAWPGGLDGETDPPGHASIEAPVEPSVGSDVSVGEAG